MSLLRLLCENTVYMIENIISLSLVTVYRFFLSLSNTKKLSSAIACAYTRARRRLSVDDSEENGKVVTDASRNRKNMPDGMEVTDFLDRIENHTDRIKHAASDEKPETPRIHDLQKRPNGDNDDPAHCDVAHNRGLAEFFKVDRVKHNADHRGSPDDAEQHPSDCAAQNGNRDRGIGSRYQKKYRIVIHDPKKAFRLRMRDRMVQRAHAIQNNQTRAENGAADYRPRIAVNRRENDQHRRSGNR